MTRKEAMQEIAAAKKEDRPANLHNANLAGADLRRANLAFADLSCANIAGANLHNASLRDANLRGADLADANLRGANLAGADLAGADLYGANLGGANLYGANLTGADLTNADLGGLRVAARATRSDGHEYFCWTSILGGLVIRAGCRTWTSFDQARKHCRTETAEEYRAEALNIIDYLEKQYAIFGK